eukprot:3397844-Amphidinium_carterae.1
MCSFQQNCDISSLLEYGISLYMTQDGSFCVRFNAELEVNRHHVKQNANPGNLIPPHVRTPQTRELF